eukprot:NODE_3631_length_2007_cov_9.115957.p1 GENE.NODE_3631_length_2007_cov_9.115957~~NODE_3631_length_2007_cov_9.115957.p1  ORF type:complete len:559 (+),score=132.98 NODE_3631_length_2007_cov_9.115957:96-1772(+)
MAHLEAATPKDAATALPIPREVLAFYRANSHPGGYRYLHVPGPYVGAPLAGLSAGWLPAVLLEGEASKLGESDSMFGIVEGDAGHTADDAAAVSDAAAPAVADPLLRVRFHGWFCDSYHGAVEGLEQSVPRTLLRPFVAGEVPPRPLLSLLCVRWWNYWEQNWWSDYNVTSDLMLCDLLDGPCSVHRTLPGEYEAYTVFVRCSEDLTLISEQWARWVLRGFHAAAWYFLWPTAIPPGVEQRPGCVCERAFFALAQRLERAGIRSAWPHPSQLYRLLCGKLWVPQMSLNRDYRVPPTVRVHFQEFAADSGSAVRTALQRLAEAQRLIWGEAASDASSPETIRGVAKLGFSWMGKDVIGFIGAAKLEQALRRLLFGTGGSEQVVCLVQSMVPAVIVEVRALVFRDAQHGGFVHRKVYMRLWSHAERKRDSGAEGFSTTSAEAVMPEKATEEFFFGNVEAQHRVEAEVDRLVQCWLAWFAAECAEPPAATRLDFLVSRPGDIIGQETVWTCEVTECGASLCGLETDARNAAALNFAMRYDESGRFPRPLPPLAMRSNYYGS